jgi:hypothetical protein
MDTDRLNRWLTLGANVGVLIGIVLLVVEVRQNNENLIAQSHATYHASWQDVWGMAAEDSRLAEILGKEIGGESLTRAEFIQLAAYWTKILMTYQWTYTELPAEESASNLLYLKDSFDEFPTLRWVWENRQIFFNSEFVDYVNQNIVDHLSDRSTTQFPLQ